MSGLAINRRSLVAIAITAVPLELIAFFGFFSCPIDVGYPPGTNPAWIAYGTAGVFIHYPLLALDDVYPLPRGPLFYPFCLAIGYADLFLVMVALVLGYRLIGGLVARASASK